MDAFDVAWLAEGSEARQPLSAAAATAFERVAPVRDFPSYRGQRHFPGLYWAASTNSHVGFESWLERDHAIALDFDPQVVAFASQPFWLYWRRDLPHQWRRRLDALRHDPHADPYRPSQHRIELATYPETIILTKLFTSTPRRTSRICTTNLNLTSTSDGHADSVHEFERVVNELGR